MKKVLIFLTVTGLLDSLYLSYEHFSHSIPPCTNSFFSDCGTVLTSQYSSLFGVPLVLIGITYYFILLCLSVVFFLRNIKILKYLFLISLMGFIMSLYFVFLQIFIIKAICLYCMLSAITSSSIFFITTSLRRKENLYGKK